MADISLEMVSLGRGRGGMKGGRRIAYRKAPISAWLRRRLMGTRDGGGRRERGMGAMDDYGDARMSQTHMLPALG